MSYFSSFLKRLCKSYLEKSEFSERNDPKENFVRTTEVDLKDVFHKLGKGENLSTEKFKSSSSFYAKLPSLIWLKGKANLQLYKVYL